MSDRVKERNVKNDNGKQQFKEREGEYVEEESSTLRDEVPNAFLALGLVAPYRGQGCPSIAAIANHQPRSVLIRRPA
jgi:hypothetical protein